MEDIKKGTGEEIIVTKTIPQQVMENKYTKKQLRGEIDVCNEKINNLQLQIDQVVERYNQEKNQLQVSLDEVRAQKARWKVLLDKAVKLIPE